ncbi:MAG: diphthamide biosynthesis enzyme Dph2 [Acidilobaceae archaeon]|nr:diphthamide biosynthesis enzyme Dph2 [Acidilobaceae archaeon]MCX8165551.1 diphthamide biosynthesis enzyme Dph2 [Acidilobaceae archaeon]MDW7973978.1 diphthamide biosynthesis enzyme Dph2 [Sulfolobales archaeon]
MEECGELPYQIDLRLAISSLKGIGAKKVVVQLPDGLKKFGAAIARCLQEGLGEAEILIHADSVFGSCDLQHGQLWATVRPDAIVHIGHSPYPVEIAHEELEPRGSRVIYVPALSKLAVTKEAVRAAGDLLRSHGAREVAVVTTAQHTHMVREIQRQLEEEGIRAVVPRGLQPFFSDGQVIGCDYRVARGVKADAYLYYGGGIFHPLGLYLATFRPVVKLDPYEDKATDITPVGEKTYRIRLLKVAESFQLDRWGIFVGVKTGQYRPWLIRLLTEEMRKRGKKYLLISSENLTLQSLVAVDNEWFQAFSVTSCPRIPTDDHWEYVKPVLTPGETIMALRGELEPYRFPW